jgi:hypothetical protein
MSHRFWIVLTLCAMLAACNLPNQTPVAPPASPTPVVVTPSATFSTPTLIPIETLLARATPTFVPVASSTPRLAIASPINQPVNCRYGPSTAYSVVGGLEVGGQAEIVGKNIDVTWWYVKNPDDPSTTCWLSASLIEAVGNLEALPVVAAPLAQVNNIQVNFEPPSLNVSCSSFPQYVTVTAAITTNGPATVTWRWETSEGEIFDKDPLLYLEGSSQPVLLYYRVNAAKDYWLQVHILSPNDTTGRAIFKATCVP